MNKLDWRDFGENVETNEDPHPVGVIATTILLAGTMLIIWIIGSIVKYALLT